MLLPDQDTLRSGRCNEIEQAFCIALLMLAPDQAIRLTSENEVKKEVWTWFREVTGSLTVRLSLPRSPDNLRCSGFKWSMLKRKHSSLLPSKNIDP